MLRKLFLSLILGISSVAVAPAVMAACGDSVCGDFNGTYTCFVEGPNNEIQQCTSANPCTINCN